jgi:outer membrane protein
MNIRHVFLSFFILSCIGLYSLYPQESSPAALTVEAAVRLALDNNLSLSQSALDVQTRKRSADNSWTSFIPTASASALVNHPTSLTGPIEPESRNVWSSGFSVSTGLTISIAAIDGIKQAKADYELGLLSYESASQELELSVRKLFYQILLLDANRELAAQSFASSQARYEQSAALARVGQASRLDEMSARVDMENMRPSVRNAEMLYENAIDSFKAILGLSSETTIRLDGKLSYGISSDFTAARSNTGESIETARLRKSIQSMEAQRNAVRNGAYIPSLRLSWNSTPLFTGGVWNDNAGSFSISLGINLDNFFPWSNVRTQIANINDNILSTQIQLTESQQNRQNRINQNIRNVERIMESHEAMRLNVELAQSSYEMYQDAYRRGAVDYQQLRGAVDSLERAKNNLLQEQYNLISATLDLEKELNVPYGTLLVGE